MIEASSAILFVAVYCAMATLGCVLLAGFFLSKAGARTRVLVAAIGGPATLFLPLAAMIPGDGLFGGAGLLLGFGFLGGLGTIAIGWPIAHFATRRLERMTRFDAEIFE